LIYLQLIVAFHGVLPFPQSFFLAFLEYIFIFYFTSINDLIYSAK
jgi:hypothetical protein